MCARVQAFHSKPNIENSLFFFSLDMAKVTGNGLYFIRRLSSSAAFKQLKVQTGPEVVRKAKAVTETNVRDDIAAVEQKTFWMKDPKSGNWIPENHFEDIDVAELRDKLLPRTKKLI